MRQFVPCVFFTDGRALRGMQSLALLLSQLPARDDRWKLHALRLERFGVGLCEESQASNLKRFRQHFEKSNKVVIPEARSAILDPSLNTGIRSGVGPDSPA